MYGDDEAIGVDEPNYDDDAYGDLEKESKRDDAIGQHDWLVTSVVQDYWPSGDKRYKIVGQLIDVSGQNKPKADLTWSPPPAPEVVKAEMSTWDQGKKRAISQSVTLAKKCREYYGKGIPQIAEGDVMRVETARSKSNEPGRLGFLRIVAIHSKDKIGSAGKAANEVPF